MVAGVFVTGFYTFRMIFMTFHGAPRFDTTPHPEHAASAAHDEHEHHGGPPKESPWVVTGPLIALAIPSVCAGWIAIEPLLYRRLFRQFHFRTAGRTTCWPS